MGTWPKNAASGREETHREACRSNKGIALSVRLPTHSKTYTRKAKRYPETDQTTRLGQERGRTARRRTQPLLPGRFRRHTKTDAGSHGCGRSPKWRNI